MVGDVLSLPVPRGRIALSPACRLLTWDGPPAPAASLGPPGLPAPPLMLSSSPRFSSSSPPKPAAAVPPPPVSRLFGGSVKWPAAARPDTAFGLETPRRTFYFYVEHGTAVHWRAVLTDALAAALPETRGARTASLHSDSSAGDADPGSD
jgi:hypothetical protein